MGEKQNGLQERVSALAKANQQLQYSNQQLEKQSQFYRRTITQMKTEESRQQQVQQQQKHQIQVLETRLAQFVQQAGLESVFQHQMKLEAQIESLKQRLQLSEQSAQELQKQLKITANALLLKESELLPDRRTSKEMLKNSLLRTIAALKDEADTLELMCQERSHRITGLEEQLQVMQAENEQLQLECVQQQEINQRLINESAELQNKEEKARNALQKTKMQIQELTKENTRLLVQNAEIPELKRNAERAFVTDELEKQLKAKQRNFELVSQNYAKLQQEIVEKTSQFERTESEFRLFRAQFSDDKFAELMNEKERLAAENEQLRAQKTSLQKALVVATRARVQTAE